MATPHYGTANSLQRREPDSDVVRGGNRFQHPTPKSHSVQRGLPGLPAASSSRDVQDVPEPHASCPVSPAPPPHDRLDPPVTSPLTSPVITMETKKQPGAPQQAPSRRKSGGQQQLRSPVVKRPAAAPVTLQGWLHKQGSEGLMLWKKRWFVLSEYCVFYYKGPEEEKLLGSILLPSYKVSPCSTEDRVYRKFAFKAEHTNMRTYYFAADTRELMVQWMNALSLASILQEGSSWDVKQPGRPSVSSISSLLNQSADDSDSGFHGYRPQHYVTPGVSSTVPGSSASKPSTEHTAKQEDASCQLNTSHESVFSNGWGTQKQGAGYYQPLYANAPPKPRRLTEQEDYGASSPELSELPGKKTRQDPEGNKGFLPRIAQPQQPVRSESMDIRYHYHQAVGQTPVHSSQSLQQEQLQRLQQPSQQGNQGSGIHAQVVTTVERRTPDTYGRSNSATAGPTVARNVVGSKGVDYEDVYNASDTMRHSGSDGSYGEVYKRSSSQVGYIKGAGPVMSLHHKQYYSERGHRESHPLPQDGGQYGHSGHHQQNYAAHRYASSVPSKQPDIQTPNMYSVPMQQQPLPPPLPPHHHNQSVQPARRREVRPNRYPPRPHSADFLDYDAKKHNKHYMPHPPYYPGQEADGCRDYLQHGGCGGDDKIYQEQHANRVAHLPRPKSSLDMMPPPESSLADNYYWSEEHYAQKMRQSASYFHQIPAAHPISHSSSSRATTPSIHLSTPTVLMSVDGGMKSGAQVGGVSSGGSVNSDCAGVVLRHPKNTELIESDAMTLQSPSRQQYQQQQQRRWSEYRDPCSDGQFIRSASARLPRQRYQNDEVDSRFVDQQQKCTSDINDGEKKIQQREESMKRLLEWKQRMLQSPLTRKPSGSSTRGIAQNELAKYYKQQVLRELATQKVQNRDLISNQDIRGGSKYRSHLEDTGTVPGRSVLRSRSQDGRRSSTSLTRYNSYSSDDEEPSDVRKARKRVRRPSQAGRSRHGSAEGKPSRRHQHHQHHHHSSVPPLTCTDMLYPSYYENVTVPLNAKSDHHHLISCDSKRDTTESRISTGSLPNSKQEIPPDAAYGEGNCEGCSTPLRSKSHKGAYLVEQLRIPENRLADMANGRINEKKLADLSPQQGKIYHMGRQSLQKTVKCSDTYGRYSSSTLKSSGDSTSLQDDRCFNEKHSDSGYDTLQASRVVPGFTEFLGVQNLNVNPRKNSELVYPVHEVHWDSSQVRDTARNKEEWHLKPITSQLSKSFHCAGGNKLKGEEGEDFLHTVESPPKNIVQSRVKAFETGQEGDESLLGRESLQMQEPLKLSRPMYHPNEAHVSSLRNTDNQHPPADELQGHRNTDITDFVFGDALPSNNRNSTETDHTVPKNTSESESNPKSVRDLLADFERKSQMVKERQAAEEERSCEGGPGKRCVFSDTETLLYDTSSDVEGHSEGVKQSGEVALERQPDENRPAAVCRDEDVEDKDEEVAAALGLRERFFTSGRDIGRNIDPVFYADRRHRKRKISKSNLAATDPIACDDLEVIVTPGYLRLSMAESVETHEDSESVCSMPAISQQCKAEEHSVETTKCKQSEENCNTLASVEEHYMPMTPSKKAVLAPPDAFCNARSPSASHTVIMENIFGDRGCEESSYVEMADDGLIRSLLASEPNPSFLSKFDPKRIDVSDSAPTYATPESPRYCEIGSTGKENSVVTTHYGFLYKASTQYEPVYMEVSPLMEALKTGDKPDDPDTLQDEGCEKREIFSSTASHNICEKSKSGEEDGVEPLPTALPRTSLPDILNSASGQQKQQRKILSKSDRDSSDADDEASKDLDSLDAPRHPRFSLSDTFRPASYYLGASSMSERAVIVLGGVCATAVDQHDSSDSDLVSPPPIPTSPPPLDDFDNSLELPETSLDINKQFQMPSRVGSETESNEKNESRGWEKAPGHTKGETSDRHVGCLRTPVLPSPVYGTGEINSSGSESVDIRNEKDPQNIERLLKRRPVSDDILGVVGVSGYLLTPYVELRTGGSDVESVGSRSGLAVDLDNGVSIDLDQYLEDLQGKDTFELDTCLKDVDHDCCGTCGKEMHGMNGNFEYTQQKIEPSPGSAKKFETPDITVVTSNHIRCFPERGPDVKESVRTPDVSYFGEGDGVGLSSRHCERSPPRSEEIQYENLQMILPPPPLQLADNHENESTEIKGFFGGVIGRGDSAGSAVDVRGLDAQHAGAPYYYSDLLKGDEDVFASCASGRNVNSVCGYQSFVSNPAATVNRVLSSSASRVQPLNNQRENVTETSFVKRNDIGRKVNALHKSPALIALSFPPQNVLSNKDESRLLAEELRSTTVHFLGSANKRGQVDERNLYEADTIQRRKAISVRDICDSREHRSRSQILDYHEMRNVVNLYPHGLRDKSLPPVCDESGRNYSRQPQRRSRSLEGLIDDTNVLQAYSEPQSTSRNARINSMCQSSGLTVSLTNVPHGVATNITHTHHNRIAMAACVPTQYSQVHEEGVRNRPPPFIQQEVVLGPCEGDDLWEEDALWRESLRRVSLRHTRSLDNLDGGRAVRSSSRLSTSSAATTASTIEQNGRSTELLSGGGCVRQKVSREVTYVNDSFVRSTHHRLDSSRQREYEEDYREGRRRTRRRPQQSQGRASDDLAPEAERDDGVHYERLSRYSESLERTRRGQTYLEGYIWDEDQETFRKYHNDSTSSQQQNQSQQHQHFLGVSSLPPQPPPQPPPSFEIDREKLRQWDLMSSAPLLQQQMLGASTGAPSVAKQSLASGGTGTGTATGTGVVVGVEREETLSDMGGRRQQQQQSWHLPDLTMPHADNTDPTAEEGNRAHGPSASGSGSVIGRDPLPPRAVSAISLQQQIKDTPPPTIILTTEEKSQEHIAPNHLARKLSPSSGSASHCPVSSSPHNSSNVERSDTLDGKGKRNQGGSGGGDSGPGDISVSAGELLGRTHEELVLLLIQLRRQSAGVCKAMEMCHVEIEAQARLAELETPKRLEHLQKLDELKRHLLDLEKQYEKGKPLVNLVDNMVKLGSLYRGSGMSLHRGLGGPIDVHGIRERLEFNQKVQEQRLLAEERRDWDRVSPDRGQLQAKVQELYRLDRLLQEESGTLQSLQQDKELLEKALGGLRHKLQGRRASPAEAERYRKQQRLLEKELSRIRLLLAHNSKKLEETVAENARLEQELVVLRQKLQASRQGSETQHQRSALSLVPDSVSCGTTAALEAELQRVQQLVGDLQRQRQELSIQVRHLTEKSHTLVQQIRPGPTGVAGAGPIPGRKRHHSTWLETDLDSLLTLDHGLDSPASPQHQTSPPGSKIQPASSSVDSIPEASLYVNTESSSKQIADQSFYKGLLVDGKDVIPPQLPAPPELPPDYPPPPPPPPAEETVMNDGIGQHYCTQMDITEADDRMKRFYGIIPREKQQEIKTVRIVKRESERRQRDRDRSGNIGIPITNGTTGGKRVTIMEDGDIGTSQYTLMKQQLGCVLEEEPQDRHFSEELMAPEDEPVLPHFQRSMSLPRGFGKREQLGYQQQQAVPPLPPVRVPSPRSDSVTVLRNLLINRHRVRFESCSGSSSSAESTSSQRAVSPGSNSNRPLTAHEQLFGVSHDDPVPVHYGVTSPGSSDVSPQLSPVFKSEAARAIVMEMAFMRDAGGHNMEHQPHRRAVPREKRRHHTVSSSQPLLDIESSASPIMGSARSRDDLDMERALRPRLNAPDVVRSTMSHKDFKYNENTIDSILGTPNKILIPERYIPEQAPELSAEEQLHRLKKAEAIRKMLSETTSITTSDSKEKEQEEETSTLKKKVAAEKKQREHLLQLNQILAKQVMEKSKMVAVKALATLPLNTEPSFDEDDLSPIQPLPLFQQRENYFS